MKKLYIVGIMLWCHAGYASHASPGKGQTPFKYTRYFSNGAWKTPFKMAKQAAYDDFIKPRFDSAKKTVQSMQMHVMKSVQSVKKTFVPDPEVVQKASIIRDWTLLYRQYDEDDHDNTQFQQVIAEFIVQHREAFEDLSVLVNAHDEDGWTLLNRLVLNRTIETPDDQLYTYLVNDLGARTDILIYGKKSLADIFKERKEKKSVKRKLFPGGTPPSKKKTHKPKDTPDPRRSKKRTNVPEKQHSPVKHELKKKRGLYELLNLVRRIKSFSHG